MTLDFLIDTGAVTLCKRRRLWSLYGPLLPIALGLGMIVGSAVVVVLR